MDTNLIKNELTSLLSFLYIKQPFYNALLTHFNITLVSNEDSKKYKCYSIGTKICIDIEFANSMLDINKKFLFYFIIHELLHIILLHKTRSFNKDKNLWSLASDISVDNIIKKDKLLKSITILPEEIEGVNKIYDTSNNVSITTEKIYQDLLLNPPIEQEIETECNQCDSESKSEDYQEEDKDGDFNFEYLDNHKQWEEDKNDDKVKLEKEIKDILVQSYQTAKSSQNFGGLAGELSEVLEDIISTDNSLEVFINKLVQSFKKTSSSYKRPDRRYLYRNLIAPSQVRDIKHFDLLFYIDTSGSMNLEDISKIMFNIFNLVRTLKSYNFDIIQSDTKQCGEVLTLNQNNPEKANELLNIKGRGGTELKPLFEHLIKRKLENSKKYDVCIVASDLYINTMDYKQLLQTDIEERLAVVSFKTNCCKSYFNDFKNKFLF